MSNRINGPSSGGIEMLLLEHQQQLGQEGKLTRDQAHEVSLAFQKLAHSQEAEAASQKRLERIASYFSAVTSAANLAGGVTGVGQGGGNPGQTQGLTKKQWLERGLELGLQTAQLVKASELEANGVLADASSHTSGEIDKLSNEIRTETKKQQATDRQLLHDFQTIQG